jgi:arylsulfatase A-like enzyme
MPNVLRYTLWVACLTQALSAYAQTTNNRPNILFVFADDWGRYASAYAAIDKDPALNGVIKTPHVDRVAREGVLFRNAFVNAPSCTPCRSSLMSGRYFFNTGRGAILNGAVWDPAIPSFPLLLRDAGYHIGKSYKVWSPGTPADAPFGGQAYAYEKAGRAPNNFSEETEKRLAEGLSVEAAHRDILDQVRKNFDAFLADRKPGQPWLYYFGPTTTHRTWVKGSGKKHWAINPDELKDKLPQAFPDVPEVREDVTDYLGECQAVDACVGVLMKRLEEAGEREHTVVVLSGDHGFPGVPDGKCNLYDVGTAVPLVIRWPGGKAGRVIDDLVCLPDLAPTFMELGGVKPPPGVTARSLVPLLESDKSGQIDPTRTWVITGRERHVAGAREGNRPYPMRALRTSNFLYIRNFEPDRWPMGAPYAAEAATPTLSAERLENETRYAFPDMDASPTKAWIVLHRDVDDWKWNYGRAFNKRPAEELYDLIEDPGQTQNLASDPAFAPQTARLGTELISRLRAVGDPRVCATPVPFENPPFTGPEEKPQIHPAKAERRTVPRTN